MSWEDSYDKWKTTPPEPKESRFKCDHCGEELFPGDKIYEIEGENLCENCAHSWLDGQWRFLDESECYERNL